MENHIQGDQRWMKISICVESQMKKETQNSFTASFLWFQTNEFAKKIEEISDWWRFYVTQEELKEIRAW